MLHGKTSDNDVVETHREFYKLINDPSKFTYKF